MQINLVDDGSGSYTTAPTPFKDALSYAVNYLDSLITNPITVTIEVGFGYFEASRLTSQDWAVGDAFGGYQTYSQVNNALISSVSSAADLTAYTNLNATDPINQGQYFVSSAQERRSG